MEPLHLSSARGTHSNSAGLRGSYSSAASATPSVDSITDDHGQAASTIIDVDSISNSKQQDRNKKAPHKGSVTRANVRPTTRGRPTIHPRPAPSTSQLPIVSSVLVEGQPEVPSNQQSYAGASPAPAPYYQAQTSANHSSTTSPLIDDIPVANRVEEPIIEEDPNPNPRSSFSNNNNEPPKAIAEAQPAELTDFLENRNLQVSLGGFLCVVVCIAVLVLVLVFNSQSDPETIAPAAFIFPTTTAPSLSPTMLPTVPIAPDPPTATPTLRPSTLAPTGAPLLLELSDETVQSMRDPLSPQSIAYDWLENHPQITLLRAFEREQIMAVMTIYYALNGDESFWDSEFSATKGSFGTYEVPLCQWTPFVEDETVSNPVQDENLELGSCNALGQLTHLNLHNVNGNVITSHRHGTLAPEISLLTNLNKLEVNFCQLIRFDIKTFLPTTLRDLPSLRKLQYVGNNFKGTIPPILTDLVQLTSLSLDNNALSGSIPKEIGLLTNLNFLSLSWNSFRGTIPSTIGDLHVNLKTLRLYKNRLIGPVPSELALLTKLKRLELQNNDISGNLPSAFCADFPDLTNFRLDCHQLACPQGCSCTCT